MTEKTKKIVKILMPNLLLTQIRIFKEVRNRMRRTYSGVYANFKDAPKIRDGYVDDEWPLVAEKYSQWAVAKNQSGFVPAAVYGEIALLPLLISISEVTRILDFGGATGFSYIATTFGAMRSIKRYVVVEHPKVCEIGRSFFKNDPKIEFLDQIPNEKFDLVFMGSSLQYVENYKKLLSSLADLSPKYIFITKIPAGENNTFVSTQVNLPRMQFTSWIFNAKELVDYMFTLNYKLIFRSANEIQINQGNVDSKYRLERQGNFLFEATGSWRGST